MKTSNAPHRFVILLILLLAFFLRVTQLNEIPRSLNLDEAINGLDALRLFRLAEITPFLQNNFGRETLFFYLQGLALQLYGISLFSFRILSVFAATLTIALLYAVGKRLRLKTNRSSAHFTAILAAAGLAVSYWHIYFSRMALRAIILPPLLLGLVWCFWQGWNEKQKDRQWRWLMIAGALLGLTLYTYLAARLLPFLLAAFFVGEIFRNKSTRKTHVINFLVFSLAALLVALPLGIYYQQYPRAFGNRSQAISIFATHNPLNTLGHNFFSFLKLHFFSELWLGQWPTLNLVSSVGLLVGLAVCIYQIKKPVATFLLLWWTIGLLPILFSIQDWTGQTTILRGIVAWPATFLISAMGLAAIADKIHKISPNDILQRVTGRRVALYTMIVLLLTTGALTTACHYFFTWAATYNTLSDHPPYIARYLNSQTGQLTLTPLKFYTETVANFLLQQNYPTLSNIEPDTLHTLLESNRPAVFLLPNKSAKETTFALLDPAAKTAYLLPPLNSFQIEALENYAGNSPPLSELLDSEQEPIAQIYPLAADAPFLFPTHNSETKTHPSKSINANFNDHILLIDYRVEPAVIKPGETAALTLNWQAQRQNNRDYYLFIHLFHVSSGQRLGQINTPLTGILFDAYRWPLNLTVPDIHYFTLPSNAPEGAYRFEVGLYYGDSQQRLPVSIEPAQSTSPDDKIILGKLHVRQLPLAPPQIPLDNLQFGQNIALVGFDFDPAAPLRPGQKLNFSLRWQAITPISQNYTVFTHLLDANGNIKAQQDNFPQQGRYPTSWWDSGETIVDPYTIPLPTNLEAGPYTLRVGLYQPETGQRLTTKNGAQNFVDLPASITIQK